MALLVPLSFAFPQPGHAGAWLQDQGKTQIIFSFSGSQAHQRFDRQAKPHASGSFSKQEFRVFGEYGVSTDITFIAGMTGMRQSIKTAATLASVADTGLAMGGRVRLWSGSGFVVSLEAVAHANSERAIPVKAFSVASRRLESPIALESRIQLGYGFKLLDRDGFADLQVGSRWQGGSNRDQIKLDIGLGWKVMPSTLLMLQSFNTLSPSRDRRFGLGFARQHKLQASIVQDLTAALSIQIGAFQAIAGKEALRERGGLVAMWWKF